GTTTPESTAGLVRSPPARRATRPGPNRVPRSSCAGLYHAIAELRVAYERRVNSAGLVQSARQGARARRRSVGPWAHAGDGSAVAIPVGVLDAVPAHGREAGSAPWRRRPGTGVHVADTGAAQHILVVILAIRIAAVSPRREGNEPVGRQKGAHEAAE